MIKKRGSVFWIDFWVGSRRVRKSLKTDEYGLALERARDLEREMREDPVQKKTGVSIREFSKRYIEWAWTQKPASAPAESLRVEIIIGILNDLNVNTIEELTPYHIEQLRTKLKARTILILDDKGKKTISKDILRSKSTINRYTQLLRGMIYKAIDWEMFAGPNPVKKIKFYRENPGVKGFTPAELKKIKIAIAEITAEPDPGSPVQHCIDDIVSLALNTGLRRAEILSLRWPDWRDRDLHVLGKGGRRRIVPLNSAVLAIFERQIRRTEYIFDIPNRRQAAVFRRTFGRIRKLSGVDFTLHKCRHTFATSLLAVGVDIVTISEILGHSRTTISLLYSHSSPDRKKKAVELLLTGHDQTQ